MNNSDSPAMPLSGDAYQDFASYDDTSKTSYNPECQGLTKREMMAMHIMANICYNTTDRNQPQHYEYAAESAVNLADALLKELEK
jgi:hypothetical protein